MKTKMLIIPIDALGDMLKDYCRDAGFPLNAKPIKIMKNFQTNKLGLVVESEDYTTPQSMEEIKFALRRVYGF